MILQARFSKNLSLASDSIESCRVGRFDSLRIREVRLPLENDDDLRAGQIHDASRTAPTMVQSHAERHDAICDRMMTGLQSGDMHQAVEAGVVILDSFGGRFSDDPHKDVGLRLILASLLTTNRKAPGDYSRSIRLIRDSLKDMPPQMAGSRFRVAYDPAVALCALAREGGALEPCARAVISGLNARPELNGVTGTIIA